MLTLFAGSSPSGVVPEILNEHRQDHDGNRYFHGSSLYRFLSASKLCFSQKRRLE
jgi:hypothetical protein